MKRNVLHKNHKSFGKYGYNMTSGGGNWCIRRCYERRLDNTFKYIARNMPSYHILDETILSFKKGEELKYFAEMICSLVNLPFVIKLIL